MMQGVPWHLLWPMLDASLSLQKDPFHQSFTRIIFARVRHCADCLSYSRSVVARIKSSATDLA